MRKGIVIRNTLETKIKVEINLDGSGEAKIDTGVGFLDHMLELVSCHSDFDLSIKCVGDLKVDDVEASFENGTLKIKVPKVEESKDKKRIEIK